MTSEERDRSLGPPAWALPVVIALAAVWLAMLLLGGNEVDRSIIRGAHVGERPWVLPVLFVTRLGDWEVLLALPLLAAGWLLIQRRRRLALLLVGSVVVGRLLVSLQKVVLGRVRPDEFEHLVSVETFAFPSGHAANSMIVYLLLALFLVAKPGPRSVALIGALVLSLMIGLSRVLLAVHWPTDVVGGWAFGLLWVLLTLHLRRRWAPDRPP